MLKYALPLAGGEGQPDVDLFSFSAWSHDPRFPFIGHGMQLVGPGRKSLFFPLSLR